MSLRTSLLAMMTERNAHGGVTREATAARLNVSVRTVARYIKYGHLTAIKRPNGRVLVAEESIEAFLRGEPALAEGGDQR